MYAQWVLDDMLSLTYIESSRPVSPDFEYISENQNPWLVRLCPQAKCSRPYHVESTPPKIRNDPADSELLSAPTTCLSTGLRSESSQARSNYLRKETALSFGLRSASASIWTPPPSYRKVTTSDNTTSIYPNGRTVSVIEPEATGQQTQSYRPKKPLQNFRLCATTAGDVNDRYPTSDANSDQHQLDEFVAFAAFDNTDIIPKTTPALHPRSSYATERRGDTEIFSYISNSYPLLDQPFFRANWTMGFNMRLPLARLDNYLVALRQIIRRCCEATTIT